MTRNLIIIFFLILTILICLFVFDSGTREARAYHQQHGTGQAK